MKTFQIISIEWKKHQPAKIGFHKSFEDPQSRKIEYCGHIFFTVLNIIPDINTWPVKWGKWRHLPNPSQVKMSAQILPDFFLTFTLFKEAFKVSKIGWTNWKQEGLKNTPYWGKPWKKDKIQSVQTSYIVDFFNAI